MSDDVRDIDKKELIICGYPEINNYKPKNLQRTLTVNQFGASDTGKVEKIVKKRSELQYRISTLPGQSGAPIIMRDNDSLKIVGIHKGGVIEGYLNGGRVMTSELITTLKSEVKRMGATMFLVDPGQFEGLFTFSKQIVTQI